MKRQALVELSVKDFRAIKSAEIALDGITVVSGINGSGKSTVSKLLYYIIRDANAYDELILSAFNRSIRQYVNVIGQIQFSLYNSRSFSGRTRRSMMSELSLKSWDDSELFIGYVKEVCDRFKTIMYDGDKILVSRIKRVLGDTMDTRKSQDLDILLDKLVLAISNNLKKAEQNRAQRPFVYLKQAVEDVFDDTLSKKVSLKEFGDEIYDDSVSSVPILHYINKVAYIDTPMVIGMEVSDSQPLYWNELNGLLKLPPRRGYPRSINSIIRDEVINGNISYDDDVFSGGFKFQMADGREVDLSDCATGIKSFAMLQLLLKNLYLDENTLLIIDEPEAHLHPQWIIEYARIIVLLHKKAGVKFFIASHSPDMVAAIRSLAGKERCMSSLSFYLSEAMPEGENQYVFRNLGHDIEPVFGSFNKSYEKLISYAEKG